MNPFVPTISKEALAEMPNEKYTGRVIPISTLADAKKAVSFLLNYDCLGFDTETRPSFKKGVHNKVCLMQISTEEVCFLFRLNMMGFPVVLEQLLVDPKIKKIGLSLRDDFNSLRKRTEAEPQGFIELQNMVKDYGITDISLQKVYAILFGKKISKAQRLSNWEAASLSEAQQHYAALDAWATLRIYNELMSINKNK